MSKNIAHRQPGLIVALIALCASLFMSHEVSGQSTDQSSPTPITSNELTITGPKKVNQQYYYSFTGGPGEVTMALNVKAKAYSTFVGIKVFDAELNTLTSHNMSADTSSPGLAMKKFDVGEKQTLILSFTSDSSLAHCKIKLGGAVEFAAGETPATSSTDPTATQPTSTEPTSTEPTSTEPTSTEPSSAATSSADPAASNQNAVTDTIGKAGKNKTFAFSILDAVGNRFNIPATGKLRIEMKDGSVQEIDLTQVKKILVKKNQ